MKRIFLYIFFSLIVCFSAKSLNFEEAVDSLSFSREDVIEDPSPEIIEEEEIELIVPQYEDWKKVTLNGKLKMRGLPVSPGVRIFMEKDSLIEISIKVPFMGEVGRIILNPDKVLGINKMNNTYTELPLKDFLKLYPGGLSDLQNLLLARVVIPGYGVISPETSDYVEVYITEDGLALVPLDEYAINGLQYGYIVDQEFNPSLFLVFPDSNPEMALEVSYEINKDGYDMSFNYHEGNVNMEIRLELKNPEWKGEPLKEIKTEGKFKYLGLGDFIRNFVR